MFLFFVSKEQWGDGITAQVNTPPEVSGWGYKFLRTQLRRPRSMSPAHLLLLFPSQTSSTTLVIHRRMPIISHSTLLGLESRLLTAVQYPTWWFFSPSLKGTTPGTADREEDPWVCAVPTTGLVCFWELMDQVRELSKYDSPFRTPSQSVMLISRWVCPIVINPGAHGTWRLA